MRHVIGIAILLTLLLGRSAGAHVACGTDPNDAVAVTAAEAAVASQCSCCMPHRSYVACVASVLRTAQHAKTLAGRCMAKVHHDVAHACPLGSTTGCALCNADSDCAAGAFCECRRGSCTQTAGVCVVRPQVCPDVVVPVCGCDGTTYGNDCLRQQVGACKLHDGRCVATGGCFDTIADQCTGQPCSPAAGCPLPNEFCSPTCGSPPPTGTCFDTVARKCTTESCGPDHTCLPNQFCVASCPPPPPTGKCFVTVENQCSQEPCGPGVPCRNPNEFCSPKCLAATCTTDADCNDGNGCTADTCINGTCEHVCVCAAPNGASSCCPGPAALCVVPCGMSADGTCGGTCPGANEVCTVRGTTCACTSTAPACGDTFPTCNGTCPLGSTCESLTGAPTCQCVAGHCTSGTGTYFETCGDPVCGAHRPHDGVPICTTERAGDPCPCLGATCDPGDACNRLLQCAAGDPTHGGICPISRRRYKKNIEYLGTADLQRLHDELLKFHLASYQYNMPGASPATHLGFIIDDVAPSASVAANGDTVDLYGYTSMAVAAVQTQAQEIDALKREVESLRTQIATSARGRCGARAAATRHRSR